MPGYILIKFNEGPRPSRPSREFLSVIIILQTIGVDTHIIHIRCDRIEKTITVCLDIALLAGYRAYTKSILKSPF